jgi:hypothetical protein
MQKNPDSRDLRYLQFVTDRMHGHSDKQIANKLVSGPPTLLYRQLANDGYPVCPACGAAPIDKKHSCRSKRQPGPGMGKSSELPDPSLASELFADTLRSLLARVADLEPRHESSQDGRIVGRDTFVGSLYLSRHIRPGALVSLPTNRMERQGRREFLGSAMERLVRPPRPKSYGGRLLG